MFGWRPTCISVSNSMISASRCCWSFASVENKLLVKTRRKENFTRKIREDSFKTTVPEQGSRYHKKNVAVHFLNKHIQIQIKKKSRMEEKKIVRSGDQFLMFPHSHIQIRGPSIEACNAIQSLCHEIYTDWSIFGLLFRKISQFRIKRGYFVFLFNLPVKWWSQSNVRACCWSLGSCGGLNSW